MSDSLHLRHVVGYGFALGTRAIDLEGDTMTDDKRALLESWRAMEARVRQLEAEKAEVEDALARALSGEARVTYSAETRPIPAAVTNETLYRLASCCADAMQRAGDILTEYGNTLDTMAGVLSGQLHGSIPASEIGEKEVRDAT